MAPRKRPEPRSIDIETEVDGEKFRGYYTVDRGLVRVRLDGAGSKTTQVGGLPAEVVAEMLLGELALLLISTRRPRPSEPRRE